MGHYSHGKKKVPCSECGKTTIRLHPILEIPLCANCQKSKPAKYRYITKTRAMQEYRLRRQDLSQLGVYEVDNPHYTKAAPMQLYLLPRIEELALNKWGSKEPYIVELVTFSQSMLETFLEDAERLKQLTCDEFERFVAELFIARGYDVRRTGNARRKDGGVDIVAWPQSSSLFPYLMAVQVKHHRTDRKTRFTEVRDFHGVINSCGSHFRLGVIITNTTFTPDAKWFADQNQTILRLRDLPDLRRWLRNEFNNEHEWREIPDRIELAPGVSIEIPKPKLWLPHSKTV